MYARVLVAQVQPDKSEELIQTVRDSVLPAVEQEVGFKGLLLLNNTETGEGISITLWDTPVDLKASETSGYLQEQLAKVAPFLVKPPAQGVYEVSVQV
jgi:heme-degrading monooxygenase HmoA